jgi:hypothetical protein
MADRFKSLDQKRTDLTPGTVLVREWDRQSHRVMVLADGFAWNGQTYDSVSKSSVSIWFPNRPTKAGSTASRMERLRPPASIT